MLALGGYIALRITIQGKEYLESWQTNSKSQTQTQTIMKQINITNNGDRNANNVGNDNTINQKNISQKEISTDEFKNLLDDFIQDLHKIVVQDNLDDDEKEDLKNQIKKLETEASTTITTKTKSTLRMIETMFSNFVGSFSANELSKHADKLSELLKSLPSIMP